jgi:glyoxylase-like metal-dependent hydrolase (beta-lactamase superfamily II)
MPGEPLTLVDTGPQTPETKAALESALETLGFRVSDLERIIVTHAHLDHFGLATALVARSGAQVAAHPWSIPFMQAFSAERDEEIAFYRSLFEEAGVPEATATVVGESIRDLGIYGRGAKVNIALHEGENLRLAGRDWRVLHTPGHAMGLICLFDPASRALLSSDHLLADISSNPVIAPPLPAHGERPKSLILYLESLQRVAALGAARALPGHGPVIHHVAPLVNRRLRFHRRRSARVVDCLANGVATTWDVVLELFPHLDPLDILLAVSEVIGHLELLEAEGKVVAEELRGVTTWRVVPGGVL